MAIAYSPAGIEQEAPTSYREETPFRIHRMAPQILRRRGLTVTRFRAELAGNLLEGVESAVYSDGRFVVNWKGEQGLKGVTDFLQSLDYLFDYFEDGLERQPLAFGASFPGFEPRIAQITRPLTVRAMTGGLQLGSLALENADGLMTETAIGGFGIIPGAGSYSYSSPEQPMPTSQIRRSLAMFIEQTGNPVPQPAIQGMIKAAQSERPAHPY